MGKIVGLTLGVGVGVFVAPKIVTATGATTNGVKLSITVLTIALAAWGGMVAAKAVTG